MLEQPGEDLFSLRLSLTPAASLIPTAWTEGRKERGRASLCAMRDWWEHRMGNTQVAPRDSHTICATNVSQRVVAALETPTPWTWSSICRNIMEKNKQNSRLASRKVSHNNKHYRKLLRSTRNFWCFSSQLELVANCPLNYRIVLYLTIKWCIPFRIENGIGFVPYFLSCLERQLFSIQTHLRFHSLCLKL